ncbi:DUF445 domain-containing protein [Mammaliicoccus vitulinus]|uniref:DUF445 domain-containing protein n=2 Tax=Mammaliicoccus vitulinus TaxID=71237 RepID=A0ABX7HCR4_9STAP|nr:DUF445 family protein [Mammaliicoccus vitulinus]MBM6628469.1 DUF445 domain-containing protein [Mammaliicoccus vitulinus]MBO3078079.1 DUF445 domain-containing protein [Mammaliicoccus vitulinus]MEB7658033.1 DUF445 family protein [Mammaliicoccus vitulinus]PNZ37199.1 DUF445 domain-containing protein [Mammaliicoccus vitulinus]QQT14312.1 DUF445 domain-containing protein [Mammaliicoccus vitulinus]
MSTILTIISMMVIGAIIGGFTNFIAIKMLFHPYHEIRLFGYKLPFTPGLIPKRRNELSEKVGEMVTKHLLTPEVFKEKLVNPSTKHVLEDTIKIQFNTLKEQKYTIQDFVDRIDYPLEEKINETLEATIQQKVDKYYETHKNDELQNLIPEEIFEQLSRQVDRVTPEILNKIDQYLSSEKGEQDIYLMVEEFFEQKGKMVGMIQMFMTTEDIVYKVKNELRNVIKQEKIETMINLQVQMQYEKWMSKPLKDVLTIERKDKTKLLIAEELTESININKYLNTPLYELVPKLFSYMEGEGTERFIEYMVRKVGDNISLILERMKLAELIKNQIDKFELSYLEKLVIEISNKELKLITLLGFVLGGIIGLFQGIIAIFV